MQHIEGTLRTHDGLTLYTYTWRPEGQVKAALIIVHGFGEHCRRYTNVANWLVPMGYAVYSMDLRGYGRSEGRRGHITRWSDYTHDVELLVREVQKHETSIPLFMLGHSLGGLIALDYEANSSDGLRGIIVTGPTLGSVGVSPVMFALSKMLSRIVPAFTLDIHLDATAISRDPAVVKAYRDDPLVHSLATARLGTELTAAKERVNANAPGVQLPLLIMQGGADRLAPPEGSRQYFERVALCDKQYRLFPDAFHELHNDVIADEALAEIARWLEPQTRVATM